jgi:hypothetical protein
MSTYTELLEHIQSLKIIDTHEHLPFESERSIESDVLEEWLAHYFSCDLVPAGMSDEDLAMVRDSRQDIRKRWEIAEPYWHAAEGTGHGRSLSLAARNLYDIGTIGADTIELLNERFQSARNRGGHYDFVLKLKCGIALSIRDEMPVPYKETDDEQHTWTRCQGHLRALCAGARLPGGPNCGAARPVHSIERWLP